MTRSDPSTYFMGIILGVHNLQPSAWTYELRDPSLSVKRLDFGKEEVNHILWS